MILEKLNYPPFPEPLARTNFIIQSDGERCLVFLDGECGVIDHMSLDELYV